MKRPLTLIIGAAAVAFVLAAVAASAHMSHSQLARLVGEQSNLTVTSEASGEREAQEQPEATETPEPSPTAEPTETDTDNETDENDNEQGDEDTQGTSGDNEGGSSGGHDD